MPSLSDLINANINQFNLLPSSLPVGFSPQRLAEMDKIADELEGTKNGEFFFTLIEANVSTDELQRQPRTYRNPEMITFIEMRYDLSQYQCDEVIEIAEKLHKKVKIPVKELVNMRLRVIADGYILMMTQIEDDMNYDMVKKFTYNKKNSKTDHNSNLALLDATSIKKKYQFYEEYLEKILRMKPLTKKQKAEIIEDIKKSRSRFLFLKEE
ncbi:MAG: hypothetical protein LBU27_06850 [Candidatus Peribacteria bacterium]|jgi:hypothetical protein|nr:hypothetical protein [Candidatus Peribacteria bacterium]